MDNDNKNENTESNADTPPPLPKNTEEKKSNGFEPMDKPATLTNTVDALLKKPASILHDLQNGDFSLLSRNLLISIAVCLAVFGFILGLFSGNEQLWAAPAKVLLGVAVSGLITLPSLYIFSCLNGLDVNLKAVAGTLTSSLALMSLLLIGLAPVSWIFTQSTDSAFFVGFLTLVFWGIALGFGLSLIFKTARLLGVRRQGHLAIWAIIFVVVTLQMSTSLRPIIGQADSFFPEEKKFFLSHWFDQMGESMDSENRQAYVR